MDHRETQREALTGTKEMRESEAVSMARSLAETIAGADATAGPESETVGVCIECAVQHHRLSQTNRPCVGEGGLETSLAEAWIDERRYAMLPSVGITMRCRECHRINKSLLRAHRVDVGAELRARRLAATL